MTFFEPTLGNAKLGARENGLPVHFVRGGRCPARTRDNTPQRTVFPRAFSSLRTFLRLSPVTGSKAHTQFRIPLAALALVAGSTTKQSKLQTKQFYQTRNSQSRQSTLSSLTSASNILRRPLYIVQILNRVSLRQPRHLSLPSPTFPCRVRRERLRLKRAHLLITRPRSSVSLT